MSLYDYTVSIISKQLAPLRYRVSSWQAMFVSLLTPLQWSHDNFFNEYVSGSLASDYSSGTTYAIGDRAKYTDGAIYEAQIATTGNDPTPANIPGIWLKISDDYRGAEERVKYTAQKLTLEYILNHYFGTVFRQPDSDGSSTPPTPSDIKIVDGKPYNPYFNIGDGMVGSPIVALNYLNHWWIIDDNTPIDPRVRGIYVPDSGGSPNPGWWTAFNSDGHGEDRIRNIVDKYNIAGCVYFVTPY